MKDIEAELRIAKEKAEEANRLKMEFIQNMEHDIRTPFSGIFGLASTLLRREQDEKKKEYLSYITQSAKELLDYCNGILDFSKIEFGEPIVSKRFNLTEAIERVTNMELAAAKNKNLSLTYELIDTPKYLLGDEHRLIRILVNLLSNAIKFTEQGQVKLTVKGYEQNPKKIILKFTVEDTGIGIHPDKQKIIGQKFVRLLPSNKGIYKGLGLGLPVVKQYINDLEPVQNVYIIV